MDESTIASDYSATLPVIQTIHLPVLDRLSMCNVVSAIIHA